MPPPSPCSHPEVFGAGEHTVMRPVASRLQELMGEGAGPGVGSLGAPPGWRSLLLRGNSPVFACRRTP